MKTKTKDIKTMKTMVQTIKAAPTKHLDKKMIEHVLGSIIRWLEQQEVHKESAGVMEEYQQLLYAVEALYTYIYTHHHSHLTQDDAKVFASYVSDKVKKLKEVIEKLG